MVKFAPACRTHSLVLEAAEPDLRALQIEQDTRVRAGSLGFRADGLNAGGVLFVVPWDAFSRNTSTPLATSCASTPGASVEGPRVATILVLGTFS